MHVPSRVLAFPRLVCAGGLALALVLLIGVRQAEPASAADAAVAIPGFSFSPASLTVPVGTRVVWTNMHMNVSHTVTSDTGAFDSGNLTTGQTYSFTFNTPGAFPYHCTIHPNMKATIIVQAAGQTTAATTVATSAPATVRPAATATGAAAVPVATRPGATVVPAGMPNTGGGGLATSFVDEANSGGGYGLWFGAFGLIAVTGMGVWYGRWLRQH